MPQKQTLQSTVVYNKKEVDAACLLPKNEAWAPPPGLLSSVFVHTVHQVIVQSDEVADKRCGAQPRASSLR